MKKFGHDLEKAYDALPANQKVLTVIERGLLRKTNDVYIDDKGFDYVQVGDIATAYSRFPDLASLDALAKKLLGL